MALPSNIRVLPRSLFLLLLLGLAVRISLIAIHQRPLLSDEKDYHQLAVTLSTTGEYSVNGIPTAYRPIAYPALVAAIYSITGEHPIIVKILQAIIDMLIGFLLYIIIGNESTRTQIMAFALWCFYLPAILYTNFLLTETIFTFLLVVCCYAILRTKFESKLSAFLIGAVAGTLTLMKPGMALFVLSLAIPVFVLRIPFSRYAFVLAGALLVLSPWLVRNYTVLGKPTLGTNGGINLLIGNNPNATGAYNTSYPDDVLQASTSEVEADEMAYRYAGNYILEHPGIFVVNGIKKLAHLVSSEGGLLVLAFHDAPEDFSEQYAAKYASISMPLVFFVNANYMAVMLLGALGFLAAPRTLLWLFVLSLLLSWVITHVVFFGGSRYHFPFMPFLVIYSALVIPNVVQSFRGLSRTRKGIFVAVAACLITVWVVEFSLVYNA